MLSVRNLSQQYTRAARMYSGAPAPERSTARKTQLHRELHALCIKGIKDLPFNPLIISCCAPELELWSTCTLRV